MLNPQTEKKCIFLTSDDFEYALDEALGTDINVEYELDGITISDEDDCIDTDKVREALAKYFEVREVTSFHIDDCEEVGVWIVYKDDDDYITSPFEFECRIIDEYEKESTELCEEFFSGVLVHLNKADFLRTYAHIQHTVNGDEVVRIKEIAPDGTVQTYDELIPQEWENEEVTGDAKWILLSINQERKNGGPAFGRFCMGDTEELLDLVYGQYTNEPT